MPHQEASPAEEADPEDERADLDEDERAVVHPGLSRSGDDADEVVEPVAGADGDDGVTAVQRSAGPGAGSTSVSRTMATMEQRVRVRALRIAERAADERRIGTERDLLDRQPRDLLAQAGELREDQRAAEHFAAARSPRHR